MVFLILSLFLGLKFCRFVIMWKYMFWDLGFKKLKRKKIRVNSFIFGINIYKYLFKLFLL